MQDKTHEKKKTKQFLYCRLIFFHVITYIFFGSSGKNIFQKNFINLEVAFIF
jgi:hypothetical protein